MSTPINSASNDHSDRQKILAAYTRLGDADEVARKLGMPRRYVRGVIHGRDMNDEMVRSPVASQDTPLDELTRRKYEDYNRLEAHKRSTALHTIHMKTNAPIGLGWFGDLHLDNNGCNLKLAHEHAAIVRETPGLYGASLGDHLDFWVGRLLRLYADADTTDHDGRRLLEDFIIKRVGLKNWLLLMFGNHDIWDGKGNNPLNWMTERNSPVTGRYNVKIKLVFPNKREVLIWVRHDFPGNSMWHDLHGLIKEAQKGARFHIFAAGHKHTSSHHEEFNERSGIHWHAFRSAGYKVVDEYPEELNLPNMNVWQCPVTIIDPMATTPTGLVKFEADTQDGADRLTFMRKKHGG